MYKLNNITAAIVLSSITIVMGCGSDSDNTTPVPQPPSTISLSGSGVKGPIAGAKVLAYLMNTSSPNLKGTLIDEGATDSSAQIVDLALPTQQLTSVLLEIIADTDTTDITTGLSPVITQLKTVVTPSMFAAGQVIFATPFTSVAVDLAITNADKSDALYSGNIDGVISEAELLAALPIAASQVKSALGFGLLDDIDIFSTAPLVTNSQTTSNALTQVAAYRTAIEALSAVILNIQANALANNNSSVLTSDDAMSAIALDLSDGEINGQNGDQAIAAFSDVVDIVSVIMVDPSTLKIPSTDIAVTDIENILASEITITGTSANVSALQDGSINVTPVAARVNSDIDGDGVADRYDAFPKNPGEDLDTDNDGMGNNADTDDDNDGVLDIEDAFPLDPLETLDTDIDGIGNNADPDDDNDSVLDAEDAFPLDPLETLDTDIDSIGNNADPDDDNDGVLDAEDAFPLDPLETLDTDIDGIGNNADPDDDNDGVLDAEDAFPFDPLETLDTDNDGIGNNADTDDDNDGIEDPTDNCPLVANPDQKDIDQNGTGDRCQVITTGIFDISKWDDGSTFK
ncbi:thrombospondin type 3 repeat-containing protein [Shewanella scandinavica]|uniref:thrombospondin type 3 repeat-containing protein n=1 Tax=Shewanella scandinavica TaxID=3063538 RepID=UPI003195E5C7